jgi:hypothetical protein
LLDALGDGDAQIGDGVPLLVKRSSGSSTRLPMMVVWLSVAMVLLLAGAG